MASFLHPRSVCAVRLLGRGLLPALASLAALSLLLPGSTLAQSSAEPSGARAAPPAELERIVVTATRRPTPVSELASSVTVLDRETIEREQSFEALELLRDVPGFTVVQSGSRGGATSLFVRGAESNHNLVLVDGIQVNRGGGDFDFANLSLNGVERIEVVRGPAAALYGSDAISSVIHVITRRGEGEMRASVRGLVGSERTHEVGADLAGGDERFGYSLSMSRYATDGTLSLNNDSENSSFRGRFDLSPAEDWDLSLTSTYIASSFDSPTDFVSGVRGGFAPVDPGQGRDSFEWYNGLHVAYRPSDHLEHRLLAGYTRDRFDNFDQLDPIPSDFAEQKSRSRETRKVLDYQLLWDAPLSPEVDANLALSLEYERQRFTQSTRSDATRTPQSAERRNRAGFLMTGLDLWDRLFLTTSGRVDDNSEFGTELTGQASAAYLFPGQGTKLRASYAKGFKEPTIGENFGFPPTVIGNPTLSPEKSRSFEVGIDQSLLDGRLRASLAYFRTDFEDLIAFVGTQALSTFQNVQSARSQGLETEIAFDVTDWLEIGASYTRLRTRVLDGGGVGGSSFTEGEELLRRPVHSGSFFTNLTGEGWNVRLSGAVVGPRTDVDFGPFPEQRVRNDDYVKLDLSVRWRGWTSSRGGETWLLLRAENLLDEDYEEAFGFEAPGRRILLGAELRTGE